MVQHHGSVRQVDRSRRLLLNQHEGGPGRGKGPQRGIDLVEHIGSKAKGDLICHEDLRRIHQRGRKREQPLLATRQASGTLVAPLPQDGEASACLLHQHSSTTARFARQRQDQILLHAQ